ncbi:MAG: response regulator [Alphaproteobacteria bacterium]|nr:response regulator [Alphaproteobacteria bacterium]
MSGSEKNIIEQLNALRSAFAGTLDSRLHEMEDSFSGIVSGKKWGQIVEGVESLRAQAHKLTGSAGTFSMSDISDAARQVEEACDALCRARRPLSKKGFKKLETNMAGVKASIVASHSDAISDIHEFDVLSKKQARAHAGETVLIVDDDQAFLNAMETQLRHAGFKSEGLDDAEALERRLAQGGVAAVIMDIIFPGDRDAGVRVVEELHEKGVLTCPVIYISQRGDFEARLSAVRSGCDSYFVKPVDVMDLVETLMHLLFQESSDPYRVLLVDDDPLVNERNASLLAQTGARVVTATDPMKAVNEAWNLRPDVILLDINMPQCDGFELAEVIRQQPAFLDIPIIFLTAFGGEDRRLTALRSGGDDFLEKSCSPQELINNILSRARRFRELSRHVLRLGESENRFRKVAQTAKDAIITANDQSEIIFWNESAERIFGYTGVEALGHSLDVIIPEHLRNPHMEGFHRAIDHGLPENSQLMELTGLRKDGGEIPLEVSLSEWQSGGHRFFTGIIRDLSERQNLEDIAEEKQERLDAIIENTAEGIVTIDAEGTMQDANPAVARIFGYDARDLIGHNVSMLVPEHERSDHDKFVRDSEIHGPRIINRVRDLWGQHKDGRLFPIELSISPLEFRGKKMFVGIMHDISRRKEDEQRIEAAMVEAETANQAKSQFLSSMSHELRTPLNSILGFAQVLEADDEAPLNQDQTESVEQIIASGNHLLTLINDVLDLSKVESGKVDVSVEDVDILQLVHETTNLISGLAEKHDVLLHIPEMDKDGSFLRADYLKLKQVLLNFLSNAVKYNRKGGDVTLSVEHRKGGKVRVNVRDTGEGIAEDKISRLFDPFERLGHANGSIEGTGIGLTITRQLVDMMGGELGVDSTPGEGSTFWAEFDEAERPVSHVEKALEGMETVFGFGGRKSERIHTVLYVEDNPSNMDFMRKIMSRLPQYELIEATTADAGLEAVFSQKPTIILMDINLPGASGYDLLQILQENGITDTTTVIALSANAMEGDIEKGMKAGFFDYLVKPVEIPKLVKVLEKATLHHD